MAYGVSPFRKTRSCRTKRRKKPQQRLTGESHHSFPLFPDGCAALRFARNAREIDDEKAFPGTGSRVDLALAFLIVLLAGALLFYLGSTLSVKA
ncbi:MAG TPA: hypothetical protein VII48_07275 [Rhizomicrobium sp.]